VNSSDDIVILLRVQLAGRDSAMHDGSDAVLIQGDGCGLQLRPPVALKCFEVPLPKREVKLPTILSREQQLLLRESSRTRLVPGFPQIRKRTCPGGSSRTKLSRIPLYVSEEELLSSWPSSDVRWHGRKGSGGRSYVRASDLLPYDCKFVSRNAFAISVRLNSRRGS